jgi:hypothetical protein
MKFFTPERYLRLQDFSSNTAMNASEQDWERAAVRYRRHLERLRPELPASFRALLRKYHLHDAQVLSMGRRDHSFVIVLCLNPPPQQVLILTYQLAGPAIIRTAAFPAEHRTLHTDWLYDEIQPVRGKEASWTHAILFSNG